MKRQTLTIAGLAVVALIVIGIAVTSGDWFHESNVRPAPEVCGSDASMENELGSPPNRPRDGSTGNKSAANQTNIDGTESETSNPVKTPDWREAIDAEMRARLSDVLVDAQNVLDARKQGLKEEKQVAKDKWHQEQRELRAWIGKDLQRAIAMLDYFGAMSDNPELALYAARMFANVFPKGFDEHLIAVTKSGAEPELERMVAMVGLRMRGSNAATAIEGLARNSNSTRLKAHATEELAGHIGDPRTIQSRNRFLETTESNLSDADASVRLAALHVILAERRPIPESTKQAVKYLADTDPDDHVRRLAQQLSKRN